MMVTGGSRGIGAAVSRMGAAEGWTVCVNYTRDEAAAQAVVASIQANGGRALAVQADYSVEADVLRMFETCEL